MKEIDIQTNNKSEMIDITSIVQKAVSKEKVVTGICVIFAPHTTAAITINENADPDVPRDIIAHMEGNSAAHVKSTFVGSSQVVLIE
ncbi:MAG: YjbQ family protein, partial [Deltaproteobacteria bacterium]|nr:YjbQ family protein [Deltaproteobacteria bacterium]